MTDPDEAAELGRAEGRAMTALLAQLGEEHWSLRTDCTEWDVRDLVSHLVAQCEDGLRMTALLRRELLGKLRHRGRAGVDAHMAVQIEDHRHEGGPALAARFGPLWERAVTARRGRPEALRAFRIDLGIPGLGKVPFRYLLDDIYNRDLLMHRIDLARATGLPLVVGGHEREIVDAVVRDLARQWTGGSVRLELTGPAGGSWDLGSGPGMSASVDAVAYLRTLAGRDDDPPLSAAGPVADRLRRARVPF